MNLAFGLRFGKLIGKAFLLAFLSFLACETALRVALFTEPGVSALRQPKLYACSQNDPDFFKLAQLWHQVSAGVPGQGLMSVHPILGWSPDPPTADNPLGLALPDLQKIRSRRPQIWFLGDSYVKGLPGDPSMEICASMQARLPQVDVVDLGVRGYGTDQCLILLEECWKRYGQQGQVQLVLFGVLPDDIDRCILSYRMAQKPHFVLTDGTLTLQGLPVDLDQGRYLREHGPEIRSYTWCAVRTCLWDRWVADTSFRDVKEALCFKILERARNSCREHRCPILMVVFHGPQDLDVRASNWRGPFLVHAAERLQIDCLDTKPELDNFVMQNGSAALLYNVEHHTGLGNEIIAKAILKSIYENKWIGGSRPLDPPGAR